MDNDTKPTVNPINIWLMNVDEQIKKGQWKRVSTVLIRESSSREFHHEGLFSEDIFGQIGSPERLIKFGYIELNTEILHPIIYKNIIKLKQFYGDIIASKSYAKWNDQTKEFERCNMDDDDADTGYLFFMKHAKDLKFKKNDSITHNEKIDVYTANINNISIKRCPVLPAGLRDMHVDDGKPASDSINTIYRSLLNYTNAIPMRNGNNPVYNGIRFAIQKKINEIYEYLFDMCEGKFGMFQRRYGSRALALGTRNVISTTPMNSLTPTDPKFFKIDELKIPLFQCANMFMPLVVYNIKQLFFNDVFNMSSDQVPVIAPENYQLRYQAITEEEKTKFLSSEGIRNLIKLFRDEEFRKTPVTVYNEDDEPYYLYLVYDDNDSIFLGRSITELQDMVRNKGIFFRKDKVRPLTYVELLYIAVQAATDEKHALVCRYPAIEMSSNVPAKVHVFTTNPGRTVRLYSYPKTEVYRELAEYPNLNKVIPDSMIPHPSLLAGLGADHDGDSVTYSTTITYRYKPEFLSWIKTGDFSISKQDREFMINNIKRFTYCTQDGWRVTNHMIGDFPREGSFKIDKHGAQVYNVPKGLVEIYSYDTNTAKECWAPVSEVTYHTGADCVRMFIRYNKYIETTSNESVGIFDYKTGDIRKIAPELCTKGSFIPVTKREGFLKDNSTVDFDSQDFQDGWMLSSFVSDGWLSDTYVGYAKNDPFVFEKVSNFVLTMCNEERFHIHTGDKANGDKKFGRSVKFHATDKRIRSFIERLNLYGDNKEHGALNKSLGRERILKASKNYLWGMLCGMLDGDGCIVSGPDYCEAKLYTSSESLKNDINLLCMRLGMRVNTTTYTPSNNPEGKAYVLLINKEDFYKNLDNMMFYSHNNCGYHCEMLSDPSTHFTKKDYIPLTFEERDLLHDLAGRRNDHPVIGCTHKYNMTSFCDRKRLVPYLDVLDKNSALYNRISNEDIYWAEVRFLEPMGKHEVFDFEVEGTKTFFVNDGILTYDTVSVNGIISKEANEEVHKYLNSPSKYIRSDGSLYMGYSDLQKLTLWNLTREPDEETKK